MAPARKRKKKHPAQHKELTSFYTAEQKRHAESEEKETEMFHYLKRLRPIKR